MPLLLLTVLAGVVGLFVGAILNATVMRTSDSLSFTARRTCSSCAVPVHPKEMLPIVGFLMMRGRCHRCHEVKPWQYPAMDVTVGALFVVAAARAAYGLMLPEYVTGDEAVVLFARDALVSAFLVFAAMFDYRAGFLPERLTLPALIVGFALTWWLGAPVLAVLLGGLAIGVLFSLQFLISTEFVVPADIRLGMLAGFLFGPFTGLVVVALSLVLSAVVGVGLILSGRRSVHDVVPYGTFLSIAIILGLYIGEPLAAWVLSIFT